MRFWGNRPAPVAIVRDHDAEDAATFEDETGLMTVAATKEITPGIEAVQARLHDRPNGTPRLQIMRDTLIHPVDAELREAGKPTCTAPEFPTYVWDPRQTSIKARSERPLKIDDHGMDMTRYVTVYQDGPAGDFAALPQETIDAMQEWYG